MKRRYLVSTAVSSVVGALALSVVAPVTAADLNPVYKALGPVISPAFNWNGFYVGANVGGAWASDSVSGSNLVGPFPTGIGKVTSSGDVGGGQFGYDWVAAPELASGP